MSLNDARSPAPTPHPTEVEAPLDFRKEFPAAIDQAFALWRRLDESIPLEWLLVMAARAVRHAVDRNDPRALDFASPVLARAPRARPPLEAA